MTEQATAQQAADNQADEKKKAEEASMSTQEEERLRKQKLFLADLANLRDNIREERGDRWEQLLGSKFLESSQVEYFRSAIPGVDPSSIDFLTGIETIASIQKMDKAPPGFFLVKTTDGLEFSHSINQNGTQRFGLTGKQTEKIKFTPQLAAQWMDMAAATGATSVSINGTTAHKEVLWLEASKRGLEVTNFIPSPETRKAFEEYLEQRGNQGIAVGVSVDTPTQDAANESKPAQADATAPRAGTLIPVEGSKIAGGADTSAAATSRHLKQIDHAKPVALLTGPDKSGPPALPPPGK